MLHEIDTSWSIEDLYDASDALDTRIKYEDDVAKSAKSTKGKR